MHATEISRDDLLPAPIAAGDVLSGTPIARSRHLWSSPDGALSSFVWDCTEGRFEWRFVADEIVHVLDGEVWVSDESGRKLTLREGDAAYFPSGTVTTWDVPVYVRKFATIRSSGLLGRGLRRLKRRLVRARR